MTTYHQGSQLSLLDAQTIGAPHNGTPTSIAAAVAAGPKVGTQKASILNMVRMATAQGSLRGLTQDELACSLFLPRSTICARMRELEREGFVVKTNEVRPSQYGKACAVYRLAPLPAPRESQV